MHRTASAMALALACCLFGARELGAQEHAGEIVCPRLDADTKLDGVLDESVWAQGVTVGPLLTLGTKAKPDHDLAFAKLFHDGHALYVGLSCRAPARTDPPDPRPRDHDSVWHSERVEIFLSPSPESTESFHLVISREGTVFDSRKTDDDAPTAGPAWNGAWRVAVDQTEHGWAVEARLPYAAFGDATPPGPGDLWWVKIGRDGGHDGPLMWPPNPTSSFHAPIANGALYFVTQNLLVNGGFETGELVDGAPEPWGAALTSSEVDNQPQGTVETVRGGLPPGERALRVTKLGSALWWPQVWDHGYRLKPGCPYEFSIMAKGTLPQVNLRVSGYRDGRRAKMSHGVQPTEDFSRLAFRFVVPEGSETVAVGLSAPAGAAGEVIYDNAVLRRLLYTDSEARSMAGAYAPPDFSPDPDPVHGLEALCERAGRKPWDLYWREDHMASHRVIFRDRVHGTWLWMLDNSPSIQYCVTASIWPGWNADGSVLMINGSRRTPDGAPRNWLCNADVSRMVPQPAGGMPLWDLEEPSVYYYHSPGKVGRVDLRTGEDRELAAWEPRPRERSYGLTKDNRSVFVTDHDGGLWVPYTPPDPPVPHVKVLDCYGQRPDKGEHLRNLALTTTTDGGPIVRVLVGTRVYTDNGRTERVVVPISGHEAYLRLFASGAIEFPTDAVPPATKDADELFQLYHLYPSCSHGHVSYSPDGEYVSWDGQATSYRVRDHGDQQQVRLSPNGGVYHTCWFFDPRFYITCVRAYRQNYDRAVNGGVMGQVFSDGTWQPVCDIKTRPAAYYYQGNFATLSRDATKVHYESSMTGVPKNYIAVLARPQPPRNLRWKSEGQTLVLQWDAPPHHREVKGYLVYRSDRSGTGYVLRTPQPVPATSFRDPAPPAGTPCCYVVTSLEHSGLESGYSAEATHAGVGLPPEIDAPAVVYIEAEEAVVDLYTSDKPGVSRGRDVVAASNWYYLYRSPKAEKGTASLGLDLPRDGRYYLWARLRRRGEDAGTWSVSMDGRPVGDVPCVRQEWRWQRVSDQAVRLARGRRRLSLTTVEASAQVDVVCLSSDPAFRPDGRRPEDVRAPGPVRELNVTAVRGRAVSLAWAPSGDAGLDHYNVYGARQPISEPGQTMLLASPTVPRFVDWGLRAGTSYHYAVTAVDRRGNESQTGVTAAATTPSRAFPPQQIELCFDQATPRGRIAAAEAPGTRGRRYLIVPEDATPEEAAAVEVSWDIEIKHAGRYAFWLRFLHKGAASSRGSAVEQHVKVFLGERQVTTVGGGLTDLSVPDSGIRPEFWTWARPVKTDLVTVDLPAGRHTLTLRDLVRGNRYDVLLITDEPSFRPADGRLHQR